MPDVYPCPECRNEDTEWGTTGAHERMSPAGGLWVRLAGVRRAVQFGVGPSGGHVRYLNCEVGRLWGYIQTRQVRRGCECNIRFGRGTVALIPVAVPEHLASAHAPYPLPHATSFGQG